ncbi:MAG TPA: hypothetical protein VNN22_21505 [Verrucomicrobiae bacterium]|nr:hypothetical protein [Verrucomicrobiae bacterium]
MKSSAHTKFRFCKPKYTQIWSSLILFGCALLVVTGRIFPKAPDWMAGVGILTTIVGLVVFLLGTIAARREWEAKRKTEAD